MSFERSDKALEAMFGAEHWQFHRIVSESNLQAKGELIVLQSEADKYLIPGLKVRDREALRDGKAVNILMYDDDTKDKYKLMLQLERPYYLLRDTTELFEKKGLRVGQRLGFRYEAHFATLVFKLLKPNC